MLGRTHSLAALRRIVEILSVGIYVNVLLSVFNLIPIPPLDGSRVLQFFLSGESLAAYRRFEQYGLLVIVGLVFFVPAAQELVSFFIKEVTVAVTAPFGVSRVVDTGLMNLLRG